MVGDREIREALGAMQVNEVCEVRTFCGYRKGSSVEVRVLDGGADVDDPQHRFACEVIQDGKCITGNPAATIHEAILGAHWSSLD